MKAVGLFSGGLDSALAIKLVQNQGIDVIALNFVSPFCTCIGKGCSIVDLAKKLGVPIKLMHALTARYIFLEKLRSMLKRLELNLYLQEKFLGRGLCRSITRLLC